MYVKKKQDQMELYEFVPPFEGRLIEENRWVRLAGELDWKSLEDAYAANFRKGGKEAIDVRPAFGALVVKEALGLSDPEVMHAVAENPYIQYFLGAKEFSPLPLFSQSTLKLFRKRISPKEVRRVVQRLRELEKP